MDSLYFWPNAKGENLMKGQQIRQSVSEIYVVPQSWYHNREGLSSGSHQKTLFNQKRPAAPNLVISYGRRKVLQITWPCGMKGFEDEISTLVMWKYKYLNRHLGLIFGFACYANLVSCRTAGHRKCLQKLSLISPQKRQHALSPHTHRGLLRLLISLRHRNRLTVFRSL